MWEYSRILRDLYSAASDGLVASAPTRRTPSSADLSRYLRQISSRLDSIEQTLLDLLSRYEKVERITALLESYEPYLRKLDSLSDLLRRLDEIEQKVSSIQCSSPDSGCKAEVDLSPVLEELVALRNELFERLSYSTMSSPAQGLGEFVLDSNPSFTRGDLRRKTLRRRK